MSDDLVKRLRDWEHVHPEDQDKPEGHLYEEAADRIEELEAKYHEVVGDKINLRAEIAELKAENKLLCEALKKLEYWFDTDEEVLDAMTPDERADHMRQLTLIRNTLSGCA